MMNIIQTPKTTLHKASIVMNAVFLSWIIKDPNSLLDGTYCV